MIIRDEFKAGVLILIGLALLVLSIWVMGSEQHIFSRQEEYYSSFHNVAGLSEGAPVRLAGIAIGRVSQIGFSPNPLDPRVYVTLLISDRFLDRLRMDSIVSIQTQGLLGDKYIEISPGMKPEMAPPGSDLRSQEPADVAQMMDRAGAAVENVVKVSERVNEFFSGLSGVSFEDVGRAAESIANLAHEIENGKGLLHRVIYSKEDGDTIVRGFSRTAETLNKLMKEIESGKGVLHALIYDPRGGEMVNELSTAAQNLAAMAGRIGAVAQEIEQGKGLAHELIYNPSPEGTSDIVNKLNRTADNLLKASQALASGSGTLGALLVDPKLYNNLVEITDGAKRSFLLKQAIKGSLKK